MIASAFVLSIWMYFGLVAGHNIPNFLPAILNEFRIYQPIIHGNISTKKEIIKVVHNLNYHGYSIGFGQKQLNQYQSYIIFTDDITQFRWNNPTYSPILVVSAIQTEEDLKEVDVSIGSEVIFLDLLSLKVYESYTINKIHITRYLGQLLANDGSKAMAKFVPAIKYTSNMENRRRDFYGMQVTGAIHSLKEDPGKYPNLIKFHPNNDTFDVTKLANNPEYHEKFSNIFELKILKIMESNFNFTSKLFMRKDMKTGSPLILSNGSTVIWGGVIQNLMDGSTEFSWDCYIMSPMRKHFVDFLPVLFFNYDEIFVPVEDLHEEMDWFVFFHPLASGIWIAIIIKSITFSILASVIEWFHDCKLVSILCWCKHS